MSDTFTLSPEVPPEIESAAESKELVVFIGAGISRLVGGPSWDEFANKVLDELTPKCLDYHEKSLIEAIPDPRKRLSIAKIIEKENKSPVDYKKIIKGDVSEDNIYKYINNFRCTFVTTNYDLLIRPENVQPRNDKDWRYYELEDITEDKLNKQGHVIHLHGCVINPESMIITTEDYLNHYFCKEIKDFLKHLFISRTVLFLGYGLEETEILEYILRTSQKNNKDDERNENDKGKTRLFMLQGFFGAEKSLYEKLKKYYMNSFSVELIGFQKDQKNHEQQTDVLQKWEKTIGIQQTLSDVAKAVQNDSDESADRLTPENSNALDKGLEYPELLPILFDKVEKLYWFDAFQDKGLLKPKNNPHPYDTEDGNVRVPNWSIMTYLVNSSVVLQDIKNVEYAKRYLDLINVVTEYAENNEYSNYRTWWQFSKILGNIPSQIIQEKDLDVIEYWLKDNYGSDLVADQIGTKWLVALLNSNDEHSVHLSKKIFAILYRIIVVDDKGFEAVEEKALFRFDKHYARQITNKVATLSGEKLGEVAILIFDKQLKNVLDISNNDSWSSMWHPAIEEHEQNEYNDDIERILIQAYRDSLDGYIKTDTEKACKYVETMLGSEYQTIHRLAIHSISNNYPVLKNLTDILLNEKFFSYGYRHEMWHFLHQNYPNLNDKQKDRTLKIIDDVSKDDEDGNHHAEATAYNKACWLAAIESYGDKELNLYKKNIKIAKVKELDHPDFSSYTSQFIPPRHKSPFSVDELGSLSVDDLVTRLSDYKNSDNDSEVSFRGLSATFNLLIKRDPNKFYLELNKFVNLDLLYINEIILAYSDLWAEKASLPWDDVWYKLLQFFESVIEQSNFLNVKTSEQSDMFATTQDSIVSSISKLIKSGTKSDDHAFSAHRLEDAKKVIVHLLDKTKGNDFSKEENAVTIAINSPRGHCLEALINLALRSCRLCDKKKDKDHSEAWGKFQPIFDDELRRADADAPEYEFVTLVVNYLLNFLYMSKEWMLDNLDKIFDQNNDVKWSYAMQGYAYVNRIHPAIYRHLASKGDFLRALNDKNTENSVTQRVIQNIAIAFLNGLDELDSESSLMNTLIKRNESEEINRLIWLVWRAREENNIKLQSKVFELWPKISDNIDFYTDSGKKIAAQLSCWIAFIDKIEGPQKEWLHKIAPYAKTMQDGYQFLENLSRLSDKQPFDAQEIWLKTIGQDSYPYPEDTIKKFLKNIVNHGSGGKRKAEEVVEKYLKHGETRPSGWLVEILAESNKG